MLSELINLPQVIEVFTYGQPIILLSNWLTLESIHWKNNEQLLKQIQSWELSKSLQKYIQSDDVICLKTEINNESV